MHEELRERWRHQEWQVIPPRPLLPAENLALDEVLTQRVGRGERLPTLRFWSWARKAIILGRFQSVQNEVYAEVAAQHEIDVVRRISGGGAMFVEPEGAITYSVYVPESFVRGLSFAESYEMFDSWVLDALRDLGVNAWYQPLNDITSEGGKIGGAAQARRGGAVLHHTTMAYQMTTGVLGTVLRVGQEKLSDKGIRSADRRVGPLRQQTEMERDAIIAHLIEHFRSRFGLHDDELTLEEEAEMQRLVDEQFGTRDWTYFLP
ncbi:MAG TPA: biotin/lipoate A/B protein ligase family protein [Thermomicrobiales bacterium]|nr:biotin/lipoate A/B protein ligase family protein [Thermomicrobiales bacterium]